MNNFADRLLKQIDKKHNPCIVGLDPRINLIPKQIKESMVDKHGNTLKAVGESFLHFNKKIIDSIYDLVPAVKPQMAFYEKYGLEGISCFIQTVKYAKEKGLIVIEDAKRNDIGSTASAYSSGHIGMAELCNEDKLKVFDLDAITVNPYLGSDGIVPFINDSKEYGNGCFILVKTSNPSSNELQDLKCNSNYVFEILGKKVNLWGKSVIGERGYSSIGAVVGATYSEQARSLRKIMKKSMFLAPGYGAQGAKADDVIPLFNNDGYGAIISSSRGVIFAYKNNNLYSEEDFSKASRDETIKMKNEVIGALEKKNIDPW